MSTPSRTTETHATASAPARLSLADLLASGVVLEWFEAVAIAQGVCQATVEDHGPVADSSLPLTQVFLGADGSVSLEGRPDPERVIPHLRQRLLEMIPPTEGSRVKQLPETSLEDFSRALEYHERPDRAGVIQDVRGRWRPGRVQTFDRPAPTAAPKIEPEVAAGKTAAKQGWFGFLAAVMVLGAGIVAISWWLLKNPARPTKIETAPSPVSTAPTVAAGKNHSASPSPAPARSAKTRSTPEPATAALAHAAATESPALERLPVLAASRPAGSAPAPSIPVPPVSSATPAPPGPVAPAARPAVSPIDGTASPEKSTVVYDATQRDVVPPTFLNPDMGSLPPAERRVTSAIEVMVNETGTIDDVKGRPPPRTLAESMQMMTELSVAKNWRFRPALKDGRAVKYRLVVAIGGR